jgi:hypothetical protein
MDWAVLTVANLKLEMKKRGLKCSGSKTKLVAALQEYEANQVQKEEVDEQVEAIQSPGTRSNSKT